MFDGIAERFFVCLFVCCCFLFVCFTKLLIFLFVSF